MSEKSFHRIIFKNTGLFGVSQFIKIAVKLISNKVAAIFLGTAGIGMIGLLENILALIQGFTSLGIASSSVREVAVLDGDSKKEKRLLKVLYHWAIITGFLGFLVAIIFSNYINKAVFENENHLVWVLALSVYFIFSALTSIRLSVLQAKKQVSKIVQFHIVSAVITAILAITLYYFFQEEGIIPVFIFSSLFQFLLSFYLTRNIQISSEKIRFKEVVNEGMPMIKLGMLLSISAIFGQICFYIIRWFLKEKYSFDTLGIYQVSNTLLVGYLGLVFSAMANDYYPRLCNFENDTNRFNDLVNDQTEMALLLVVPAILMLYLIAPFLIELLYSKDFLNVLEVLKFGLFAIVLKAIVWPIGFIPLIKGNKLLFLKQNLLGDGVNVIASILLFYNFGLLGLGIAMVSMFFISGIYNFYTAKMNYNFRYRKNTLQVLFVSCLIGLLAVFVMLFTEFSNFNYYIILLLIVSILYSFFTMKSKLKM